MISKQMSKAINEQINKELFSAYLYLGMSGWAERNGLPGAGNWFFVQTQEELAHIQRFYQYLLRQGASLSLEAIAKPEQVYKSALDLFEKGLAHEKFVTASINGLVDLAVKEKDHATEVFLQWFVNEQVEEEENGNRIIDQLKLAGPAGGGLFMIDRELATRVYTPPAAAAAT
jgi:ferritin